MTDLQKFLFAAILLNSALYLSGVFAAGILLANPFAWKLALIAAGMCYVTYVAQYFSGVRHLYARVGEITTWLSIVAGVLAGLALLWKP